MFVLQLKQIHYLYCLISHKIYDIGDTFSIRQYPEHKLTIIHLGAEVI